MNIFERIEIRPFNPVQRDIICFARICAVRSTPCDDRGNSVALFSQRQAANKKRMTDALLSRTEPGWYSRAVGARSAIYEREIARHRAIPRDFLAR